MSIKAIETRYNGYRFRSRTEARWAVFFDAFGIRYPAFVAWVKGFPDEVAEILCEH